MSEWDAWQKLLAPKGAVPWIGPEREQRIHAPGVRLYRSREGSWRFVMTREGRAVSALQLVSDGKIATIAHVYTLPECQRRGYARELLRIARRRLTVKHSDDLTEAGRAWSEAVRDPIKKRRRQRLR